MSTTPLARLSVLVVDDDAMVAEVLAELIADLGHDADIATGGRTGLARLREKAYDIVFTDIRMPDMDGVQLYHVYHAAEKAKAGPPPRFVFITGNTYAADVSGFLSTPGRLSVAKPFRAEDIAQMVAVAGCA